MGNLASAVKEILPERQVQLDDVVDSQNRSFQLDQIDQAPTSNKLQNPDRQRTKRGL